MIEQQKLLRMALERTQDSEIFKVFARDLLREQSKGRTIFSKVAAVLKAAPGDASLECHREMLCAILLLNGGRRFGIKVEQMQKLIRFLFGEGERLLDAQVFRDFTQKDLLGYLEICRRCFLVAQAEQPMDAAARPAVTSAAPKSDEPDWMNSKLSILFALQDGNKECAAYVLKNPAMYREYLSAAKEILGEAAL